MFLIVLMCLFSFVCLLVSLLTLTIVLKSSLVSPEIEIGTTSQDLVIISGCDSGIGLELAKYVHDNTQYTVLCGFLEMSTSDGYKELARVASRDNSSRLIFKKLDITKDEDVAAINKSFEELKSSGKIKNLAALVNNAGTMTYGEFDWLTWSQIHSQIEVNLMGTIRLTRSLLHHIINSKGRIINVSSVNDTTVFPGLSVYSASKSALSTLSRGLGYELRKFGVSVVTMRLGDFARLTNIMTNHEAHRDNMWNEMDSKKRDLYGEHFQQFNEHLLKNFGMTSPSKFRDSSLFSDFKRALLVQSPPNTITCAPVLFKVFYFLAELLPISLQYCLLDLLLQFAFKWNPSQSSSASGRPSSAASTASSASAAGAEKGIKRNSEPTRKPAITSTYAQKNSSTATNGTKKDIHAR